MRTLTGKYPFFLVLLPLFIIVHIAREYEGLIYYPFVYKEIIILFTAPVVFFTIWRLLCGSSQRAAVATFICLFPFYFLGEIKNSLSAAVPGSFITSYSFLLPAAVAVTAVLLFSTLKSKGGYQRFIAFVNLACLLLLAIDLVRLAIPKKERTDIAIEIKEFSACDTCAKPDVYYLVFDSYTSSNLLNREFNFDNQQIENYLTQSGFHIFSQSKSNYNITPFSIASTFHLNYNINADTTLDYYLYNYLPGVKKVYDSPLFALFEKQGYEIFNESIFHTRNHRSSVPTFDEWKTRRIYQQYNILKKTENDIGWMYPAWLRWQLPPAEPDYIEERNRHDSITLIQLSNTIKKRSAKPKFVYAHIFLPHSPYTFDSSGNRIPHNPRLNFEEDKQAYVQQLIYSNKIMKGIVEEMRQSYGKLPVVIIQGDHGYRFFNKRFRQLEFENFHAIHLPAANALPDSFSNVNTFRLLFNELFGARYPMLPDQTFFLQYK